LNLSQMLSKEVCWPKVVLPLLLICFLPYLSLAENIIFSSYISKNWEIWMIEPDGTNLTQLTHSPQEEKSPAWSSDRKKIAYATNEGEIWIIEIGGEPKKLSYLPKNCAQPTWSPDGEKIAFVSYSFEKGIENSDIWIADLTEQKAFKLIELPGTQKDPDWSPDGNFIVYTTGYCGPGRRLIEEIWVIDIKSKVKRPLVSNRACNIEPDWSPDGEWIAFASDKTGDMEIYIVDKYGKNLRQLTHNKAYDVHPVWSPDGSKICFVSTRTGKLDIFIMDRDGKNIRQLTNFPNSDNKEPDW